MRQGVAILQRKRLWDSQYVWQPSSPRKLEYVFDAFPFFKDLLEGKGLTTSIGIAYGKSHTPFSILLGQAEELLRSAKKEGAKDPRAGGLYVPSYIDYHFTFAFNQVGVNECRGSQLKISAAKPLLLYQKPYSLEDAKALLEYSRDIGESGVPKTRLNEFGQAMLLGKVNSTIGFLKLYGRMAIEHRRIFHDALDRFCCMGADLPWRDRGSSYTSALLDLIELTTFT